MSYDTPYVNENLDRLREEFDQGRVQVDETEPQAVVLDEKEGSRSVVMSVRLPARVITELKRAAEERDTGATVLARQLIMSGLADIETNRPRGVHLMLTVMGGRVLDVHIDDPAAEIGDNQVEIEVEPINHPDAIVVVERIGADADRADGPPSPPNHR